MIFKRTRYEMLCVCNPYVDAFRDKINEICRKTISFDYILCNKSSIIDITIENE